MNANKLLSVFVVISGIGIFISPLFQDPICPIANYIIGIMLFILAFTVKNDNKEDKK